MNRKIIINVVIILIAFLFLSSPNCIYAFNSGNITDTDKTIGKIQKKWILLKDKAMEFEPRLKHYVWELQMPPYIKDYDKIRLHRLVNPVSKPKAVVFIFPATYSSGEQIISE